MRQVVVRYTVKPGQAQANEELVRDVYEELAQAKPDGFRYATFRLDDGLTFLHVALYDEGADNPLASIGAFQRFTAGVAERCDVAPVVHEMTPVGSYRFPGEG
jgi:hypothetical protein